MDADRFDRLTVAVAHRATRRSALALAAAAGLSALLVEEALAACAAIGTRCGRAGDLTCCSGRCVRKSGTNKKFCRRAPGQSICTIENNVCVNQPPNCHEIGSPSNCVCWVTSRGFSFCGGNQLTCFGCETNADCEKRPEVGQPGDRCVQCASCDAVNNRGCVRKCPNPA